MIKISKKIAKIGLILSSIMLIVGVLAQDSSSVRLYALLCVVNLVAIFFERIMDDIQKVLDKVYDILK